jgi:hypothetical protein
MPASLAVLQGLSPEEIDAYVRKQEEARQQREEQ